jgi:hemerythrin superfamily protein
MLVYNGVDVLTMNEFKLGRVTVYQEYCAALRHLFSARWTDAYFPEVITDMIRLYCEVSEEEHFTRVISTWCVSAEVGYDFNHMMTMTLDHTICNALFGRMSRRVSKQQMAEMMEEFDADGLADRVSWYLPRFIRQYIDDDSSWDIERCDHGAKQLAVGFLESYVAVARVHTSSI